MHNDVMEMVKPQKASPKSNRLLRKRIRQKLQSAFEVLSLRHHDDDRDGDGDGDGAEHQFVNCESLSNLHLVDNELQGMLRGVLQRIKASNTTVTAGPFCERVLHHVKKHAFLTSALLGTSTSHTTKVWLKYPKHHLHLDLDLHVFRYRSNQRRKRPRSTTSETPMSVQSYMQKLAFSGTDASYFETASYLWILVSW